MKVWTVVFTNCGEASVSLFTTKKAANCHMLKIIYDLVDGIRDAGEEPPAHVELALKKGDLNSLMYEHWDYISGGSCDLEAELKSVSC